MSVGIVSVVSLVGVFVIAVNEARLKSVLVFLVSFAVGGLFGDVFIHILPDVFENAPSRLSASFGILAGILLFFILEKFIYWRHCHSGVCLVHDRPLAILNLVGDGLHNLVDGVMIGASYSVNVTLGLTTTLAVILHEIPQEIGDYAILLSCGLSRAKALFFNFLCALLSVAGTFLALSVGQKIHDFPMWVLPLTAGGFIYIAGSDLIPELHKEVRFSRSLLQLLSVILGIGVMALLLLLE